MEGDVICISDSDDEAVPKSSASSKNRSTYKQQKQQQQQQLFSSSSGASVSGSSSLNNGKQSCFEPTPGMALYKPLCADLMASRQLDAMKKKKLSIMQPFPVVREVVNKMRSALGTNDSQLNVLGLAQQYITSLKYYQASIINCPNRCRLLARHIIQTMCLIRDLSRHFFDSPHYSQKICELLAIYIYFELQCAGDFKDSKVKIAERIIHNIHLHLENAQSNFFLRIFSFLSNMGKENEIATKIFQRLIPEASIVVKNEFPDRLFVQYLIVFYHWKEAWNDYEDQQKIVAFANKFMKPMSTIKTNKIYAKHLPCYVRRDDATGYFLTNMVFFNDLRNASILDGIQDNGPALVDLSEEEKIYPVIDLSHYTLERFNPLLEIKEEPRDYDGTVDLTCEDNDAWMKKLIRRAVALEVILPARLTTRKEDEAPAVIELIDSDSENNNKNNNENKKANQNEISIANEDENENENEDEDDDDSWAFGPRNQQQPERLSVERGNLPADEESNSMDEIFNELNSSIDFGDDSTTESEIARKKEQKQRFEVASKLTDAQARITFDGVVEKELKAMYFQTPCSSRAVREQAAKDKATLSKTSAASTPISVNSLTIPNTSRVCVTQASQTSSKVGAVSEKTDATETAVVQTKCSISTQAVETSKKSTSMVCGQQEVFQEPPPVPSILTIENLNLFTSEIIQEAQNIPSSNVNEKLVPTAMNVDQTLNTTISERSCAVLLETEAPKEAVTISMEETLQSSFDSGDESDEDFLGRFQKPPFKTYLRRAHRKSSKNTKKNNVSSSEEDANANVEKSSVIENENNTQASSPAFASNVQGNDNPNILFSGKVISLREDGCFNGGGGTTPSYLNTPESVEISKNGSNVVFSMQGRRLSSFPSLKVNSNQTVPDFAEELAMTGEEDSNSRTEVTTPRKKNVKKSNIVSNTKNQKLSYNADRHNTKAKSVWFAESPQVREIEPRHSTSSSSQQIPSTINAINSTINKININKQHFVSKMNTHLSTKSNKTPSITKTTNYLSESNKISKSNQLIKQHRVTTTESSATTAALKSAQEKDLLKILFPEAFASPTKADRHNSETKTPALIKATIPSSLNYKPREYANSPREFKNRQEYSSTAITTPEASVVAYNKNEKRRRPVSAAGSDKQSVSNFDKYLERKKLLKPPKQPSTPKPKTVKPKTEKPKSKSKSKRKSQQDKIAALIADDPKLDSQMKPVVVLNRVAGSVFILESGISSETFTEVSPGVFKLKKSSSPPTSPLVTSLKQIPAIRTKSLSDILSDVVVQEMTAAVPLEKEAIEKTSDDAISTGILADEANFEKQPNQLDCRIPSLAETSVLQSFPLEEKEKEEQDKIEKPVQPESSALADTVVNSKEVVEVKQIKKEEIDLKSTSPEVTSNVKPSKPVSDCFKKPLKSMAQKRLASASFIHGMPKPAQASKPAPIVPVRQEAVPTPSETVLNGQEIQEPVTSTNSHLFPPLTSESESDSSCRTEQTNDIESSEHSDSSLSLMSPRRALKVRLRRHIMVQKQLEYSVVSNSVVDEEKLKIADSGKKRRSKKSVEKKETPLKRVFETADSSTSAASSKNVDQQPPQSGLINGVLVPSIEAMNTPPPTPPTTVDDKSSVADDTSQEAKSQSTPEPSNINQSHSPNINENGENMDEVETNIEPQSSNIPPNNILENNENPQSPPNKIIDDDTNLRTHANRVFNFIGLPGQRRRFESVNLPSKSRKRPRKKSTAEASNSISLKSISKSQLKKRRKTICTDVFNPPYSSSDEETCPSETSADDALQVHTFAKGFKPPRKLSITLTDISKETEPSPVRLNNENISPSSNNNICDSSRLSPSPTLAAINPILKTSANLTPVIESDKIEKKESQANSRNSRPNCDSPVTTPRNMAISRTYSKNNIVQQVFVPPEIEMFIEEPNKSAAEKPTPSNLALTSKKSVKKRKNNSSSKTKKPRKKITTTDEEDEVEQDDPRDEDYISETKKSKKYNKKGKKRGASHSKRHQ